MKWTHTSMQMIDDLWPIGAGTNLHAIESNREMFLVRSTRQFFVFQKKKKEPALNGGSFTGGLEI